MYALLVVMMFSMIATLLAIMTQRNLDNVHFYDATVRSIHAQTVADSVKQYYADSGTFPASTQALAGTSGYEHVRSAQDVSTSYTASGTLTDPVWQFKRAIVYTYDRANGPSNSSFESNNTCGSGSATTATSWCGPNNDGYLWFRIETRDGANFEIAHQRANQQRTLQKLASYFNAQQTFPNKDQTGAVLTAGQAYTLASLAGYAGSATNCAGIYTWRGVPLDCSELFDRWGNAIAYAYLSNTHIAILSTSPLSDATGNAITIGTDLDVT